MVAHFWCSGRQRVSLHAAYLGHMICRHVLIQLSIGFHVACVTVHRVMAVLFVSAPSALSLLSCVYLSIRLAVDGAIHNESLAALSPYLDSCHVPVLIAES
jgi:hypothetical protein